MQRQDEREIEQDEAEMLLARLSIGAARVRQPKHHPEPKNGRTTPAKRRGGKAAKILKGQRAR